MRKIVVPVDDSDDCARSIEWVIHNLYKQGDTVYLLHVIPLSPPMDVMGGLGGVDGLITLSTPRATPEEEQEQVAAAERFMDSKFVHLLKKAGIPSQLEVERQQEAEMIGDTIARFAAKVEAAALVMASHKKSKLQELLLGSVSKHAANRSNTATIVLH